MSYYKYFCFLILASIFLSQPALGQNVETIQALKDKAKFSTGTNRINALNDLVDEMLKPEPVKENCLAAKDYAHDAAKQSEAANYKVGMARSYEQLTLIYKTLDYQITLCKMESQSGIGAQRRRN